MKRCRQCGAPAESYVDGLCPSCQDLKARPDTLSKRTTLCGVPFQDLKQMDESKRLNLIAKYLKEQPGKRVFVMVETGPGYQDKGDRYIRGVRARVPGVRLMGRVPGPVPNVETISFQLN